MPELQAPVTRIARPVIEQTTMVSMNVWVIETRAWRTGCFVCAAAAAIPAEPKPDSFEKIPRAAGCRGTAESALENQS